MALPQYTPKERRRLAAVVDVDEQYIYQIMRGLKTAGPALAKQINAADARARLCDLRPDDWHLIWPELADQGAQAAVGEVSHG